MNKLIYRVPSKITAPPPNNNFFEFKGYRFFLPKFFIRKRGKETEFKNIEKQ